MVLYKKKNTNLQILRKRLGELTTNEDDVKMDESQKKDDAFDSKGSGVIESKKSLTESVNDIKKIVVEKKKVGRKKKESLIDGHMLLTC